MQKSFVTPLVILCIVFFGIAFLTYPGSSYFHYATTHYSLWENTISESGMTQNYRGETLVWSRLFFDLAVTSGGIALTFFFWRVQTLVASLTGLLFVSITLFPTDIANTVHNYLFFTAVIALYISFTLLYLREKTPDTAIICIGLLLYILFLIFSHPYTSTSHTLHTIFVIAQKVVLLWVLLTLIYKENHGQPNR